MTTPVINFRCSRGKKTVAETRDATYEAPPVVEAPPPKLRLPPSSELVGASELGGASEPEGTLEPGGLDDFDSAQPTPLPMLGRGSFVSFVRHLSR